MQRKILAIMGSTRAGRLCPAITDWVMRQMQDLAPERIDLREWKLPMDDEPGIPALGVYEQAHTQAWAEKIASAGGFVFVTPQYNWGYPAALKNAIDHVYAEWKHKPAMIVTYGGHGGGKCAAQLRQVLEGLDMQPVATMPVLVLTREMMKAGTVNPPVDFAGQAAMLGQSVAELRTALG